MNKTLTKHLGILAEIELGRIAAQRGNSQFVRQFGEMMVREHSMANSQLAPIARRLGAPMPTRLDPVHTAVASELRRMRGAAFDVAYRKSQIMDHEATHHKLAMYRVDAAELTALAQRLAPRVMAHLQMVRTGQMMPMSDMERPAGSPSP